MTIQRSGQTIELTPGELLAAYYEQQHLHDLADVEAFADMCDDFRPGQRHIDAIRDPDTAERVALRYREIRNDSGTWFTDMSDAVYSICGKE